VAIRKFTSVFDRFRPRSSGLNDRPAMISKTLLAPCPAGVDSSMPAIIAVWAGLIVLPKIFIQDVVIHRISAGAYGLTVLNIVAIAVRVPFFLAVVCTLWGAAARLENRKSIAG